MRDLVPSAALAAMSLDAIDKVRRLELLSLEHPQVQILIEHVLHAGMYARTAHVPAGVMITGVLVKVPTILIVKGDAIVYVGDDTPLHCIGYNVLQGAAGRKQAFVAETDLCLTMLFPTEAKTVAEAEAEFTDEIEMLQSRRDPCQA